jgi:hypothetical protein
MKGMDGLHNFVTRKCKNKEEGMEKGRSMKLQRNLHKNN